MPTLHILPSSPQFQGRFFVSFVCLFVVCVIVWFFLKNTKSFAGVLYINIYLPLSSDDEHQLLAVPSRLLHRSHTHPVYQHVHGEHGAQHAGSPGQQDRRLHHFDSTSPLQHRTDGLCHSEGAKGTDKVNSDGEGSGKAKQCKGEHCIIITIASIFLSLVHFYSKNYHKSASSHCVKSVKVYKMFQHVNCRNQMRKT